MAESWWRQLGSRYQKIRFFWPNWHRLWHQWRQFVKNAFGPMFYKETLQMARQWRYFALRTLFVVSLTVILYGQWDQLQQPFHAFSQEYRTANFVIVESHGWNFYRLQLMAALGEDLILWIGGLQLLATMLLVPLLMGGVLAQERRLGTLDLLFTSHLTDREIVAGKLGSHFVQLLFTFCSGFAVFILVAGILGAWSITLPFFLLLSAILQIYFAASITLYHSATSMSPTIAVLRSYRSLLLWNFLLFTSPILPLLVVLWTIYLHLPQLVIWLFFFLSCSPSLVIATYLFQVTIEKLRDALPEQMRSAKDFYREQNQKRSILPQLELLVPNERRNQTVSQEAEELQSIDKWSLRKTRGRLWGPLRFSFDEGEPSLAEHIWVILLIFFVMAYCGFALSQTEQHLGRQISWVLLPCWSSALVITVLLAITNPLFSHRPGFLDLLLATPISTPELLSSSVWICWPVLSRIYITVFLLSLIWIGINPIGITAVALLGVGFGGLILALGNLSAILGASILQRLLWTLIFLALALLAPWWLLPIWYVVGSTGVAVSCTLVWLLCRRWAVRQTDPWPLLLETISFHFFLVTVFVGLPAEFFFSDMLKPDASMAGRGWTISWLGVSHWRQAALDVISPTFWSLDLLASPRVSRWRIEWNLFLLYLAVLYFQLLRTWWRAVKYFDRWIGRAQALPDQPNWQRYQAAARSNNSTTDPLIEW